MVNPGKPSGGCELCRKRRIKCDEARPTCSYCRKKQVPCHFRSQFEVAWRDQTQVASNAVRRRVNARHKSGPEAKGSSTGLIKPDTSDVPRILPQDHQGYALAFFFSSYLLPSTLSKHHRGFLGCVYPVWTQASPSSPLKPAVNAVAQTLLEAWSFRNPNSSQSLARSHYVQAIMAVRRSLRNAEDVDDEVLLAMLLLDMYDGIRSFLGGRPHLESPHVRGSAAAIESRRKFPVSSKTSQGTLLGVRSRLVGDALKKGEPISTDVLTWPTSTQNSPKTPGIELEAINVEVANLQVSASKLKAESPGIIVFASELLAIANKLDERLAAWPATIPDEWVPICLWDPETIPRSVREAGLYQDHCTIHKSIWVADNFNWHCFSRMKVKLLILSCLEHVNNPVADMARVKARTTIQDLADTVCASVPYHLGDRVEARRIDDKSIQYPQIRGNATPDEHYITAAAYGGSFLMRRLVELLQFGPFLRAGQQQWILGQMGRIKKIYLAWSM